MYFKKNIWDTTTIRLIFDLPQLDQLVSLMLIFN